MDGRVRFDLDGCGELVGALHRAAREFEDLGERTQSALVAADLEDTAPRELFELAAWCDELSAELDRRVEMVVALDRTILSFLVSVRHGMAAGWLPDGELPEHLQDAWPQSADDWRELAFARADIDPDAWEPSAGFAANRATVAAVYDYYLELFGRDERLQWAAMGRLAGASVWAGLEDLQVLNATPVLFAEQGAWLEVRLLKMQRAIFLDLAWQHEAYLAGGLEAMGAALDREEINERTMEAWEHIDSGEPWRVAEGTRLLVYREQHDVLQDEHYALWPKHAPDLAEMTSANADSPVPGGKPFREVVAVGHDGQPAQIHDWEGARKVWIDQDMLAAHQTFLAGDDADEILAMPVEQRAKEYRHWAATSWQHTVENPIIIPPVSVPTDWLRRW